MKKWVRETLNSPVQIVEGYGGRKVAHRKYMIEDKEYLLRVVYEDKDMQKVVVTALSDFSDRTLLGGGEG